MGCEQRSEERAVVRDLEVEQLVNNDLAPELLRLCKQVCGKG